MPSFGPASFLRNVKDLISEMSRPYYSVYIGLISIVTECLAHDECLLQVYFWVFELVFTQLITL